MNLSIYQHELSYMAGFIWLWATRASWRISDGAKTDVNGAATSSVAMSISFANFIVSSIFMELLRMLRCLLPARRRSLSSLAVGKATAWFFSGVTIDWCIVLCLLLLFVVVCLELFMTWDGQTGIRWTDWEKIGVEHAARQRAAIVIILLRRLGLGSLGLAF